MVCGTNTKQSILKPWNTYEIKITYLKIEKKIFFFQFIIFPYNTSR